MTEGLGARELTVQKRWWSRFDRWWSKLINFASTNHEKDNFAVFLDGDVYKLEYVLCRTAGRSTISLCRRCSGTSSRAGHRFDCDELEESRFLGEGKQAVAFCPAPTIAILRHYIF